MHDSRPFGVAHCRAWRHVGPWPQRGFNLMPDLDAAFFCSVPSCRCPPNLSAWRPAATFFELEEANSKNVPNAVGTACLRTCVQHECATDGANPCAKTGACFVRNRWVPCANSVRSGLRPMWQQCANTPPRSVTSCWPTVWLLGEWEGNGRISITRQTTLCRTVRCRSVLSFLSLRHSRALRPTLTLRCWPLTIACNTAPLGVLALERVRR